MKKTLKFGLGLLVLSVTLVFCSDDDDNNSSTSTTSSSSTTSTTSSGSSNYFISGGTTINLSTIACENTSDTIFSEIIPVSTVSGVAADGSTIYASFYRGANPVASQGNYFSVNDESSLASGKCFISGFDKTRDEILLIKPNLQITLKNENGKLTVEFSDKTFDAESASFNGTRQVSAKYTCN
jgi:hypothetical protein